MTRQPEPAKSNTRTEWRSARREELVLDYECDLEDVAVVADASDIAALEEFVDAARARRRLQRRAGARASTKLSAEEIAEMQMHHPTTLTDGQLSDAASPPKSKLIREFASCSAHVCLALHKSPNAQPSIGRHPRSAMYSDQQQPSASSASESYNRSTDYEASPEKPSSGYNSYYHPVSPTKKELKAPLLDNGSGGHQLPRQYLPPGRSDGGSGSNDGGSRVIAFINTVVKLSVFHFFNAVLSIVGFVLITGGVDICIALIPLCCLGILLFPFVFFIVGVCAKLDVKLYNFVSPPSEHVFVDLPRDDHPLFSDEGDALLSPKVFSFSPQSIAAAVYFSTIKFAVGVLSGVVVTVNIWLLLAPVVQLTSKDAVYAFEIGGQNVDARRNPLVFAFVWTSVLLLNVALMHLFAKLSRASTRFFCCEKLSTYRYVSSA